MTAGCATCFDLSQPQSSASALTTMERLSDAALASVKLKIAFIPPGDWHLGHASVYEASPPALQGLLQGLAERGLVVVKLAPCPDEPGMLRLESVRRDVLWSAGSLAAGCVRLCLESLQSVGAWEVVADLARIRGANGTCGFSMVALTRALRALNAWEELSEILPGLYRRLGAPWLLALLSDACLRLGRNAEAAFAAQRFGELVPGQQTQVQNRVARALIAEGATWHLSLLPEARLLVEDFSWPAVERCMASNDLSQRIRGLDLARQPAEALAVLRADPAADPGLITHGEAWERYVQSGSMLDDASGAVHAVGLLTYATSNIGDDIQSLAAAQYLDAALPLDFFDRDALSTPARSTPRLTIMNGWYAHRGETGSTWPPSSAIDPVPVSMHVTASAAATILSPDGLAWLRRQPQVGCRDEATWRLMQRHGVNATLSGCLTLTLRRPVPESASRQTVWAVDLDPDSDRVLESTLAGIGLGPVQRRTHEIAIGRRDPLFRLLLAARLLRDYAQARVVVTSRLHCALPCIAYGTPVVMVVRNDRDPRMLGLVPDGIMVSQAAFAADPQGLIRRAIGRHQPLPARAEMLRAMVGARNGLPESNWYTSLMEMSRRVWP